MTNTSVQKVVCTGLKCEINVFNETIYTCGEYKTTCTHLNGKFMGLLKM